MENVIENTEIDMINEDNNDEQSINDAWAKAKEQHQNVLAMVSNGLAKNEGNDAIVSKSKSDYEIEKKRFYEAQQNNQLDAYYNTGANLDKKDQEKLIESRNLAEEIRNSNFSEMKISDPDYRQLERDMKKNDTINVNHLPKSMTIYDEITRRSDKLNILLKGTCVSVEKLIHAFQMELYKSPKLQSCQKDSLLQALMRCGEMGLIPGNGIYLIPYNGIAQTQVSLQGWLTMLWRSGNVGNIIHNLHREGDEFSYSIDQAGTTLFHKPKLEMDGEILGSYAMVTLKNQHIQFKYCNRKEIEASKNSSKTKRPDSPWNTHFDQMAQIVPLRKLARTLAPSLGEWDAEETTIEQIPLQEPIG